MNAHIYPAWFKIATDYLVIQASAIPCEWVFSSSVQTDTTCRNKIRPELTEAFQVLKYALKKQCLNFIGGWGTDEMSLGAEDGSASPPDFLGNLLDGDLRVLWIR